jgi:hypothetical protein
MPLACGAAAPKSPAAGLTLPQAILLFQPLFKCWTGCCQTSHQDGDLPILNPPLCTGGGNPVPPPPVPPVPVPPRAETIKPGYLKTLTSPTDGTYGPDLPGNTTVNVSCRLTGPPATSDGNPCYYRIASSPWSNAYYATADGFYNNGQGPGARHLGNP